ncbi:hypothetical protein, partial [Alicyclobacillus shizuokensis]|uniref:hypothetical protein n=1 Tax=Alicyclobacillus shizuokensis TaxID=392014 RepID=UPI001C3F2143
MKFAIRIICGILLTLVDYSSLVYAATTKTSSQNWVVQLLTMNNGITNLATFMTAVATLVSVFVLDKQRRTTFEPHVIFGTSTLHFFWDGTALSPHIKTAARDKVPPRLDAYNIGLGTAKNVSIEWIYDIEQVLSVCTSTSDSPFGITYEKNRRLIIEGKRQSSEVYLKNDNRFYTTYMLPVSVQSQSTPVPLPYGYVALFMASFIGNVEREFPPLKCIIKYRDIGNRIHKVRYTIELG